jgi:hypothetical protein
MLNLTVKGQLQSQHEYHRKTNTADKENKQTIKEDKTKSMLFKFIHKFLTAVSILVIKVHF